MAGLIILAAMGGIILWVGVIWSVIIAFRESTSHGLLSLFVPFYVIYYDITRWAKAKKPFVIGLIGLVLFVCGIVPSIGQFKSEAEPVIAAYMEAGAAGDVDGQYKCCSPRVFTKEEVSEFLDDNYALFEGFKDVSISSWSWESRAGITTGYVAGAIIYTDDTRWPFEAWLVKENDVWKLTGFQFGR